MSLFSKNLRFLRKKGDHNQDEIALLFDKRANTIGNWENQKSEPSISELLKLGEYFDIDMQTLLHTDLELESSGEFSQSMTLGHSNIRSATYSLQETFQTVAQEANPDAFWLILKELRAVNEKLDQLNGGLQFPAARANADKSSH
jgi:transcriptional regulator with XRE-family HTH domain